MNNSTSKPVVPKANATGAFKLIVSENSRPVLVHDFNGIIFSQRFIAGADPAHSHDYVLTLGASDGTPDFSVGEHAIGPTEPCFSQLYIKGRPDISAYAESGHVSFEEVSASRIKGSYSCRYSANGLSYDAKGEFNITPNK